MSEFHRTELALAREEPVRLMSAFSGELLMLPGVSKPPKYLVLGTWDGRDLIKNGTRLQKLEWKGGELAPAVDESGQPLLMGQ
eukprot:5615991-Alexandrium_andersonii.AAC.1